MSVSLSHSKHYLYNIFLVFSVDIRVYQLYSYPFISSSTCPCYQYLIIILKKLTFFLSLRSPAGFILYETNAICYEYSIAHHIVVIILYHIILYYIELDFNRYIHRTIINYQTVLSVSIVFITT